MRLICISVFLPKLTREGQIIKIKKMRTLLHLSILIHLIMTARPDVRYLDFEDNLDMFQDCSIHLIQNDLEVSFPFIKFRIPIITLKKQIFSSLANRETRIKF